MAEKNYFQLFNQPIRFTVDVTSVERAYKLLMARLHPDRFVNASALEKRLAEQMSVRINEARQTLCDDLLRAQYMCRLQGLDPMAHRAMDVDFLIKQMQWREALEQADELGKAQLKDQILEQKQSTIAALTQAFDVTHQAQEALNLTRELLFIEKLLTQLNQ